MPEAEPLVIEDLHVSFGAVTALDGLTLTANHGEVTAVLGPNGAGKTTMMRCCTGLVRPDSGSVSVMGHSPGSPEAAEATGLMPQSAGAWSGIRAGELLHYMAGLHADPIDPGTLIEALGIRPFARTTYRRLSGGQQQSVNLAAALIGRPRLVFLDEPTAGMDPHARHHTWDVVEQLRHDGVSVVLTTHAMDEAARLADHIWIVDRGKVAISGSVAALTAEADLEAVFLAHTSDTGERG
ncbi:Daunorubicin/doxorubicin resistance ATP-binding protein DrrA [Acidipropionibacterium virtanenii]|uniref:Daunorubicin/doxorubicin resistance ATP-binding protein DrrA n=1 Tax=Acidipropionibacterium virtanenii TaxID=2057246 RepID=A0A344UT06_9ACTN|nr:Daunorubicin/doxorubicin resistance ATP-binding protein DrrA [Acidipropionibacterium virtanenii]